jgi:transcriptional regulator with XRE-family HTH domain
MVQPEDTERDVELPEDSDGGLDFVRALGKQFRVLRERADLSQEAAAGRLGYSDDLISSIERGRRVPQTELLRRADRLYDAGGVLAAVADDLEEAKRKFRTKHPAWFRTFVRLEAQAKEINEYATMVIPGLLQTEAYARAIHRARQPSLDDETIERRVTARLARQEILNAPVSWPPPKATFVIEESVLLRPVGNGEVRRGQLLNLLRASELQYVEIQIMPIARDDHPSLDGPFTLLTPKGRGQLGYVGSMGHARLITDPEEVRLMAAQYGSIRAQALGFRESRELIEKLLGDL